MQWTGLWSNVPPPLQMCEIQGEESCVCNSSLLTYLQRVWSKKSTWSHPGPWWPSSAEVPLVRVSHNVFPRNWTTLHLLLSVLLSLECYWFSTSQISVLLASLGFSMTEQHSLTMNESVRVVHFLITLLSSGFFRITRNPEKSSLCMYLCLLVWLCRRTDWSKWLSQTIHFKFR